MAQLKDTIIQGSARITDTLYSTDINLASGTASLPLFTNVSKNIITKSASDAWTALGGGESGKHADSYFVQAIESIDEQITRYNGTDGQVQRSLLSITDAGDLDFYGNQSYPLNIRVFHIANKAQVARNWYDTGATNKITTGIWTWRQYSPNSTANNATTGKWEDFQLPAVTVGLNANATYDILTTKNTVTIAQGGTGQTTALAAYHALSYRGAATDFNTALSNGTYSYAINTNGPHDGDNTVYSGVIMNIVTPLATHNNVNTSIWQFASENTTNNIYIRNKINSNNWSDWERFARLSMTPPTDNNIVRFDGTDGLLQDSSINITDTGNIVMTYPTTGTATSNFNLQFIDSGKALSIGYDYSTGAGASISLYSSISTAMPSGFALYAKNTTTEYALQGYIDGALKWSGRRVVTAIDATAIGSVVQPIYIDSAGQAQTVIVIQKVNWSLANGDKSCKIEHSTLFNANSIVLQIVVESGESNLSAPLTWLSGSNYIAINTATAAAGAVSGYALIAQGQEYASDDINFTYTRAITEVSDTPPASE